MHARLRTWACLSGTVDFQHHTQPQTKLPNPHYKPEVAAQCTIVNFIATEKGLEDQLLSKARTWMCAQMFLWVIGSSHRFDRPHDRLQVVSVERPELEEKAQQLQQAFQVHTYMTASLKNYT